MYMKSCNNCLITQDLNNFYSHPLGKDGKRSICKDCFKLEKKNRIITNPPKINKMTVKLNNKKFRKDFKEKHGYSYFSYLTKRNDLLRITTNLRCRLRNSLKSKKWHKNSHFKDYIGCDQNTLKNHLESNFQVNMSWENYGKWHIDHIIPLSSAKTEEDLYKLCHYTNLQPLWAKDNYQKSNSMDFK